ncbi:hypothetical protein OHT52_19550 [Streptomyces sp. NBC_00247]|uniref:hypothetical protein n=1 Tax=Streptomyces sp. NBC_00247 TaxID=2975689 RepID=UPI002E292CC7|nr:hypothetical protein [Streptomyces sp. NBC_00247]
MDNSDDSASEPPDDFCLSDLCNSAGNKAFDALCRELVDALRGHDETTERTDDFEETSPVASRSTAARSRLRAARRKAARRPGAGSHPRNRSDVPRNVPSPRPRRTWLIVFLILPPD